MYQIIILGLIPLLGLCGCLAMSGFINPFIAGAFGLVIGDWLHLNAPSSTLLCIAFYLTTYFSGAASRDNLNTVIEHHSEIQTEKSYLAAIIPFTLALILPIPKPPFLITGLVSLPILVLLLVANRDINDSDDNLSEALICVLLQTILLGGLLAAFNYLSNDVSPVLGLICATAIPKLIDPIDQDEYNHIDVEDIRPLPLVFSLLLTWATPGYSSHSVSSAFFSRGKSQALGSRIVEGAIEGYATGLIGENILTGKSPLGDLLNYAPLDFGTYSPNLSFFVIGTVIYIGAAAFPLFLPNLFPMANRSTQVAILTCQAAIITGPWVILFIAIGFLCHLINAELCPNQDYQPLSLLVPMLF